MATAPCPDIVTVRRAGPAHLYPRYLGPVLDREITQHLHALREGIADQN